MLAQSTFMIAAPVAAGRLDGLRVLLSTMNDRPGIADPDNTLVPFGRFDRLHVARFVILEANTADDISVYGKAVEPWTPTLAFLGDCDGPADTFIAELAATAEQGLRRVFSHCSDSPDEKDRLVDWMHAHNVQPNANYINTLGRTVSRIREEQALHEALSAQLHKILAETGSGDARSIRQNLLSFVELERHAGRLTLSPPPPTDGGWWLRHQIHKFGVPLLLLALSPLIVLLLPFAALRLRMLEKSDPEIPARPDRGYVERLARLEDHDVTNQFSAFGDIKPQAFRRYAVRFLLWLLDYTTRHIYNRGFLTRVQTIHFARWVMLDDNKRVFFASNYDGSLESYMDDFINKVAWGLNLVFSNGVGYPGTRWLIKDGAEREQEFKRFLRRKQLPTEVWYKAYPGLTAFDLARNSRIRHGVEHRPVNDQGIREWLAQIQA